MKNIILLISHFIRFFLVDQNGITKKKDKLQNDLSKQQIKGKVKTLKIATNKNTYTPKGFFDNTTICLWTFENEEIYKYDDKGNNIEYSFYLSNHSLSYKLVKKYDNHGNLNECIQYDSAFNITKKNIYNYDNQGHRIDYISYDSNQKIKNKETYHYNAKGKVVECESFDTFYLNNPHRIKTYNYNLKGNLIHYECRYSDGKFVESENYKYSSTGNLFECECYDSDGKRLLNYDNNGNLIQVSVFNSDGMSCKNTFYKYNIKGNLLKIISSDYNVSYVYENYDKEGNWLTKTSIASKIDRFENQIKREIEYY